MRCAVVYEAGADFRIGTDLADRVLVETIDWLDQEMLIHQRYWLTSTKAGSQLTWSGIKQLAFDAGIRAHGHFDGAPGLPDAKAARRAIEFLKMEFSDLDAIILIRDEDHDSERRDGLEQARKDAGKGIQVVIGLAIVERECWVLSGFDPQNDDEQSTLEELRRSLGFDPRTKAHELTACKNDQALRSPKRVLGLLCNGDPQREPTCWQDTSLERLRERGQLNGLAQFLGEVEERLAPLLGNLIR